MEPVVATGESVANRIGAEAAKTSHTVAADCRTERMIRRGVDGSSPSEVFTIFSANRPFSFTAVANNSARDVHRASMGVPDRVPPRLETLA
jgi:hypothetical protein